MRLFDLFKKDDIKKADINDVVANIKKEGNALLVDVREPEEYKIVHIPGSINMPLEKLPDKVKDIRNKDIHVYVYCASGIRSSKGVKVFKDAGFTNVTDAGGIYDYNGPLKAK